MPGMLARGWKCEEASGTVPAVRTIHTDVGPLHVVASRDDARQLWRWLRARRKQVLGLDIETVGLDDPSMVYDQDKFKIRLVQISDGIDMWVIQAERPGMLEVIRHVVYSHDYWVAHFAGFAEIRFLTQGCPGAVRVDQDTPHIACTQPVMACYDPRTITTQSLKENIHPGIPLSRNLKQAVARYCKDTRLTQIESKLYDRFKEIAPRNERGTLKFRKADDIKKYGFTHIDVDDEIYLTYGGYDALFTVRMWKIMVKKIKRRGLWDLVKEDLLWQWHADIMTAVRGLPVDGEYAKWLDHELESVIDEHSALLEICGVKLSGTGKGVGEAFHALGVKSPKRTKGGSESWDKWVIADLIETLDEDHPAHDLAFAIQTVRRATKFRSTYMKPILDCLNYDGKVHCELGVIRAITGRNSASKPPVQQLPKHDKRVRAAFRAPPGWVFVTSDFRQGEPRVMAANSGDENLRRDILSGDFNSALATRAFGDKYHPQHGKEPGTPHFLMRQGSKAGFLSKSYGAGIRKFADTVGVPLEQGKAIYYKLERDYPNLTAYTKRLNKQDYVVLDSGRIVPLWDKYYVDANGVHVDRRKESRNALNYATQGNQRDLLWLAVKRHIEHGWMWALVMFMHDELVAMVPEEMAEEYARFQKWSMTMDYHGMPIECETDGIDTPGPFRQTWMPQPDEFDLRELEVMDDDDAA